MLLIQGENRRGSSTLPCNCSVVTILIFSKVLNQGYITQASGSNNRKDGPSRQTATQAEATTIQVLIFSHMTRVLGHL